MSLKYQGSHFASVAVIFIAFSFATFDVQANRERPPEPTPTEVNEAVADATDVRAYLEERAEVMRLVRLGEFGRLPRRDSRELNSAWSSLQGLLRDVDQIAALSASDKLKVYNAQQVFDSIITKQRDSGLVCLDAAPTGSRINRTRCMSVAEREAQREANQDAVRALQGATCVPGSGGESGSC